MRIALLFLISLMSLSLRVEAKNKPSAIAENPRQTTDLSTGWRFQFGDAPETVKTAGFDDSKWEAVSVPHTWNRIGEYALTRSAATNNKQGVGYYRLTFNAPPSAKGRRQYLDFAAVAIIADVWVNGLHVGQHKGGYSRFRFDVTSAWKPGAANLIVVKADNSKPAIGSSTEHVLPLAGDFFQHGGMYRGVSLIEANDVGIDLLDFGGPGVYVDSCSSTYGGTRMSGSVCFHHDQQIQLMDVFENPEQLIDYRVNLRNWTRKIKKVTVNMHLIGPEGKEIPLYQEWIGPESIDPSQSKMVRFQTSLTGKSAFTLWKGQVHPALYRARVDVKEGRKLLDSIWVTFGRRFGQFDPNTGFSLNGNPLKLKGVSRHQDRLGKGYALTREDHAEDMKIIKEMGANSVRQAHYQHADEWSDEADKAGMIVWAEVPFVTTPSFTGGEGSAEVFANAEQQTRELIRQNYNHPSIMMWSVGNEVDAAALFGISKAPGKPRKLLDHIARIAREEDLTRPTIFADCCEERLAATSLGSASDAVKPDKLAGAADMIGYNRYYGWYTPEPLHAAKQLGEELDTMHAKHPTLPISISEYGAGGATTQHSDNVLTGFVNAVGRPQPEEYESWVHEQSWPVIRDRDFVLGSYVWNMFDFASDLRNEGDAVDINTKGLVTMDRKTKKDSFYYYKAQWSDKPMIHITGQRYVDRAYSVMDVKAYSSAGEAVLMVNGKILGAAFCPDHICIWRGVALRPGPNEISATNSDGKVMISDKTIWNGPDPVKDGTHLDAGDIAGRLLGTRRFGSDNFVTGGTLAVLNQGGFGGRGAPKKTIIAPDPALYDYWREGEAFSYALPVPDGKWTVTIHSFEPGAPNAAIMSILANGKVAVPAFNVGDAAGGSLKGINKSFPVTVTDGILKLDFSATGGKAVVAAIEVTK
jgi:beta-galactosidase